MSTTSRNRRLYAGVAGATFVALALVSCAQSPNEDPAETDPSESRTEVVVAWTGDINSMDPPNNPIEWNRELSFATYETLVNHEFVESEAGSLVWMGLDVAPGLADSWEIDGPTVTFHLNEDAVFYPSGNPVTAEDVYWSFDRALEHPGGYGLFNFNLAGIFSAPDQIEVIDDKTVSITFQNSSGDPLLLPFSVTSLRFPHFGIIDSVAAQEHATPEDPWAVSYLDWNTLGSGAYYVAERKENEEIIFEAVPDYYRGQPAVTRVVATISANADLVALMKSGAVDIARAGLSNQQLDELEASGFTVLTEAVPNIVRLALAMDDERLADPLVRKAIAYAIPYEQINNVVYSGRGEKAESIVNPLSPDSSRRGRSTTTTSPRRRASSRRLASRPWSCRCSTTSAWSAWRTSHCSCRSPSPRSGSRSNSSGSRLRSWPPIDSPASRERTPRRPGSSSRRARSGSTTPTRRSTVR
ncbi:hypothetical protein KAE78_05825 [Microbacterium sp. NIBRBAC000506063]|nr:ABC transporter substrate-binding protein [Microbacterium sp. NIBRBAC000506063]QTV80437.1 hypothetical protein KAE78_05825 [Microbacterium sp. NIBRBAC000506063]